MKNITLAICFLLTSLVASAQEIWIEAALKGGYGASSLLNKNILDDDAYSYQVAPSYNFGGKLALNFGAFNGFSMEGLLSKGAAKWQYDSPLLGSDRDNEIEWKNIDALLLFRHINHRVYFELGPKYSKLRSVKHSDTGAEVAGADKYYKKDYISGVLGFGGYITGTETFSLGLGLRFHYGLTDFVTSDGQKAGYPNPGRLTPYESTAVTRPILAEFMVEFNFGIGHWAQTSCSERMHFYRSGR
ncbi:MAG: hypothetical protein IT258_14365 [Saprospiraceae bacterium]|nr:hypothetical protein [Saprospiraceae bacterium]